MTTQDSTNRQIQFLFTVALASLLILGTARIVLDNLKNRQCPFLQLLHLGNKHKILRVPVSINDKLKKAATNGRPDSLYQNWRWQPSACNLPRFDALKLLEVLRNKRLMFVGDSIQRGMFDSMVCLVQSVIPDGKKSLKRIPPRKIFTAKEYNASIEYFWAPFIVESNSDNATNHTVIKRLVNLDSISKHGKQWEGVDILVFESYIWWMYKPLINTTFGSPHNVQEYKVATAYRLALEAWANWIEANINPRNQDIYFMSMSPTHLWSWEWKPRSEGNCFNESHPIHGSYWGTALEIYYGYKSIGRTYGASKKHDQQLIRHCFPVLFT
ncbi:hypothetical protein Vadar_022664 [Vaccinium darrowii]|uniref:Uncharacterized protein n=1 Tax=Vaccinium darrowii TaxID=229202 RepID=A0ACB7YFW3_9ERIC|nr:hypothetical protein Vadar_022664 [Vaccinium darrowii]